MSALEAIANKGGRVVDNDVTNLTESLMNELIKLDTVVADGDVKLQRKMQVRSTLPLSLFNQRYWLLIDALPRPDQESAEVRGDTGRDQDQERHAESKRPAAPYTASGSGSTEMGVAAITQPISTRSSAAASAEAVGGGDDELGNV